MYVLPAPVARLRSARVSPRAIFSRTARIGSVLVVAPARLSAAVRRAERAGKRGREVQAAGRLPAHAELVRGGELRHRGGRGRQAGGGVVFDPLVAVRAVDERDVEARRAGRIRPGVLLRLVQSARGSRVRPLRLHDGDRHGLRVRRHLDLQGVVRATGPRAPRPPVHDLDCPRRLLAADQLLGPAGGVEGGVQERDTGVGFERGHERNASGRRTLGGQAARPGLAALANDVKVTERRCRQEAFMELGTRPPARAREQPVSRPIEDARPARCRESRPGLSRLATPSARARTARGPPRPHAADRASDVGRTPAR